ncbi:LAETG motif-containing sortase-dependent surface protein [Streptomyces sp. KLOTTS4A1]|uniref:LAETG motif-containing sortase-dependent surface protein n=1 Tax=Streptomyces sp. KLOTTS4A1 TaxID=3390996 RepID=UPI0039F62A46
MSSARRSLLTATAAGSLLGALWFVPSAGATGEQQGRAAVDAAVLTQSAQAAEASALSRADASAASAGTRLAETGSTDTTPYIAGGLTFLISGVGIYALSRHRIVGG